MAGTKTIAEDGLATIASAGQNWFNNLININTEKSAENTLANNIMEMYQKFFDNTQSYLKVQQEFYQEQLLLWEKSLTKNTAPAITENKKHIDKRFSNIEWENNPFFAYIREGYLEISDYLADYIARADVDAETKLRLKFYINQYLDAISPTNFALTNPDVIKAAVETGGASLITGMQNMMKDLNNGYMTMTDEKIFTVGKNLAITKGKVIFRNNLIELIEYAPTTDKVFKIPLLIVPPCINKYYILDLRPDNSMVKYLVDQGYRVFLVSWKSADESNREFRWEEYINLGIIKTLEVIRDVTDNPKINALGYCVGGILLTTAALVMKARKLDYINSMAHMTVMLDHSDPGDIRYFIEQDLMELEEANRRGGGIMSGRIIAQTFSALRANEMIWNYWVNNYLLGKTPQAFDILHWNNDAVDLPLLMHAFLIKKLYIENALVKKDLVIDGVKMDLSELDYPAYLFAAQKDHIVPWRSAFKSTKYFKGPIRFVLGASGHTAGVVNPVSANKRNYWVNENIHVNADAWFENAKEIDGSWWNDYSKWLELFSGEKIKTPKNLGSTKYSPIMNAPGKYILGKAAPVSVAAMA